MSTYIPKNLRTLTWFAMRVNSLARRQCDAINRKAGGDIFAAVHHDFPESMLKLYYDEGLTPAKALAEIDAQAGI